MLRRMRELLIVGVLAAAALVSPHVAGATSSGPVNTALGYNPDGSAMVDGPSWVRLWDAGVDWANIEPQRGQFDFSLLDSRVEEAERHHQRVILTLGQTPPWANASGKVTDPPSSIYDWNVYVSSVAMRYGNRIAAYEPWNEPNLKMFYTGNVGELVFLSRSAFGDIRKHAPNASVLTPAWSQGGAAWFSAFAKAGGLRYADAVAAHDYPRHPGDVGTVVENFRKVGGSKPIWMTEVGCNTNSGVGCSYSNPAATGAFARDELHTIHDHNVPVALWYPLDGGGGPWMGFSSVSPYLLAYAH